MGYKYAKEVLTTWQDSGEFQQMIPSLYKRARYPSSTSSGVSGSGSLHRKTRSSSMGVAVNPVNGTVQTTELASSADDSGILVALTKRVG